MTKEAFEVDLTQKAAAGADISVITPISQLESHSGIFTPLAVECVCEKCAERPVGQRHIMSVMQMFVSIDGVEIAHSVWPNAVVITVGTEPGVTIPCPRYGATPGIKCDPATRPDSDVRAKHIM